MNSLDEIIRADVIRRGGSISFARLMELALYCPQFGFYDRIESSVGRTGHYFTSVSAGPLFGQLLAIQFTSWLRDFPDGEVQLLEAGSHDGQLAFDVLSWIEAREPELSSRLRYWILEPLETRRVAQRQRLKPFAEKVSWFHEWRELPARGVRGLIFSNELLDAMPVHRLCWDARGKAWFEWGIELHGTGLRWTRLPPDPAWIRAAPLASVPPGLLAVLPDGFSIEACPAAIQWWQRAAQALHHGRLLTFDYGLETDEFLRPERTQGTLRAYHQHHSNLDFLERIGEQDLTAHVNFTLIREAGEAAGLRTETMTTQSAFLTRVLAGVCDRTEEMFGSTWSREFQTLTHPDHLGRGFRVLVQSRPA